MPGFQSNDPRAVRTRAAFQGAFFGLLQEKTYHSITVTDIARWAGFARHTFYNHYETKEDFLANLIDTVLDEFFSKIDRWRFYRNDNAAERLLISSFFIVWQDNPEIAQLLVQLDIDDLFIRRLKAFFTEFYHDQIVPEMPEADLALARYMINFNAYTLLGILKPWLEDEMRNPPEMMADLLIQLTGSANRREIIKKFHGLIK